MPTIDLDTRYRDRRAARIENSALRVTVLREGGHIAEIFDKAAAVNPLWTPHWASIEPSAYHPGTHVQFGSGADARLLAGIMGHNLCLDIFGGPSEEEAAAGVSAHGDGSVALYEANTAEGALVTRTHLPTAQLLVERRIELHDRMLAIRETVGNLAAFDRPIAWTQHVTLGPPFLEKGVTEFRVSATRSKVFEGEFGADDYLQPAAEFDWPFAPRGGRRADRPAAIYGRAGIHRVHRAPDESSPSNRIFRRLLSDGAPRARLCLETLGFSMAGDLGREPQPHAHAVGWSCTDPRHGIRRLPFPGVEATDGRTREDVRHADVPVAARAREHRRGLLRPHPYRRRDPRIAGVAAMKVACRVDQAVAMLSLVPASRSRPLSVI